MPAGSPRGSGPARSPKGSAPRRRARTPYSSQRQQVVLDALRRHGRVDAADLARDLDVTSETVRKDLIALEARGLLVRVHGGALPAGGHSYEPDVLSRTEFADEKRRIAAAALAHLPSSGSVLLDAGSTTAQLAAVFPDDRELTVFTNALPIAMELVSRPLLTVYPLGGRLRPQTLATVGAWPSRLLDELNVDVAFLGTNGFTTERGLTTPDPVEAEVKGRMVRCSSRRVLLCDSSKLGRLSLTRYAEVADLDLLITDTGLGAADVEALRAAGVEVELV